MLLFRDGKACPVLTQKAAIRARSSHMTGKEVIDRKFLYLFDFRPALLYKFRGRSR